jgi:hypothetical protein
MPVSRITESTSHSPTTALERPSTLRDAEGLCRRGGACRVDQQHREARLARVMAMFTATVVLPSWGPAEVISRVRVGLSGDMNSRLVRIERQHSATEDLGLVQTEDVLRIGDD